MKLQEAKNYQLINECGISYDLYSPGLRNDFPIRVYGKFDLLVDGKITESPSDFWIAMNDLDGTSFVQPIDGYMLAIKLMTLAYVPLKK